MLSTEKELTQNLLKNISFLDAFSSAEGTLMTVGKDMISNPSDENQRKFIGTLAKCRARIPDNKESKIVIKSVYDSLLPFLGLHKLKEFVSVYNTEEPVKSLDELISELNDLVGLGAVKEIVSNLIAYHKVQHIRKNYNLNTPTRTLHIAFMGKPGTGKTTVARIIGKMYKQLGLLTKGHFIEVSRTDLIAGYQGQTALKVKGLIDKARGGVLFIDEAYSITENDHTDSYGRECLTELTKALEDYRDDLVVIVAGYTELMNHFFQSNPGLKSRFNTFIEFPDYTADELVEIFTQMCTNDSYTLSPTALTKLNDIITVEINNKPDDFANGRYVRNLYESTIMSHSQRIYLIENPTLDDLTTIHTQDLPSFSQDRDSH